MDADQNGDTVYLTGAQLTAIERFREDRQLASREAALAWLLDIALEAVTGSGRRYWDKPLARAPGTAPSSDR